MNTPKVSYVKAFTKDPELGNPAVVVEGALESAEAMKAIRNARCGVAALINTELEGDIPIRFFYENGDVETFMCGHATLAAAHVVIPEGAAEFSKRFVNSRGSLIEAVRLTNGQISLEQPVPEFGDLNFSERDVAEVLKIDPNQILKDLPIQLVGSPGKMKLMIPVSREVLSKIERDSVAIKGFCEESSTGLFPFAIDVATCDAHARHFPPRDEEDPVCGVGAVALAKYLQRYKTPEQSDYVIRCGPGDGLGDVVVRIVENGGVEQVFLEGDAV